VLLIGPEKQRMSDQGRTSGGSCPVVQWLPRTSRYYPEGIQKVAYIWWSRVRLPIQFAERSSSGPPPYVHTTDSSVRLAVKSPNYPSSALNDPKPKLTPPTKPLMPS
jgi:hypothetical protein